MPQGTGNGLSLVDATAADRPDIDLDQADDVGAAGFDEIYDVVEGSWIAEQVACTGDGDLRGHSGAYGVANVVYEKAHCRGSVMPCHPG